MKAIILTLFLGLFAPILLGSDTDQPPVFHVDNTVEIEKSMGKHIIVDGTIREAFWVRGNVLMLTFREEREGFLAVSFRKYRDDLDEAFDGDIATALEGVSVRIRGVVKQYKDRPQIVISDPKQIEVLLQ